MFYREYNSTNTTNETEYIKERTFFAAVDEEDDEDTLVPTTKNQRDYKAYTSFDRTTFFLRPFLRRLVLNNISTKSSGNCVIHAVGVDCAEHQFIIGALLD